LTFNQKLNNGQLLTNGHELGTELFAPCQDILSFYEDYLQIRSKVPLTLDVISIPNQSAIFVGIGSRLLDV